MGVLDEYAQGLLNWMPKPQPSGLLGQALDASAQWGRGVQNKAAMLASLLKPQTWVDAVNNMPKPDLSQQVSEDQKRQIVANALNKDYMNFAPMGMINAWHGSPHNIPLGRSMRMDKIGTGEGAQAYGHGLYTAESPEVAKAYSTLGHIKGNISTIGGKNITEYYSALENQAARLPPQKAAGHYEKLGMLENLMNNQTPSEVVKFAQDNGYSKSAIDWFKSDVIPKYDGAGKLYKLELSYPDPVKEAATPLSPNDFLHWDLPLSQQPEKVRKALADAWMAHPEVDANLTGAQIYRRSGITLTGKEGTEAAAESLHKAGIPGIRYLDGGSRTLPPPRIVSNASGHTVYWGNDPSPVGKFKTMAEAQNAASQLDTRTHNYVLFDPKLVNIVGKE